MQNYIFIDIDGPLLPGRSHLIAQNREFLHQFNDGVGAEELFEKYPPVFDPWAVRAHNLLAKHGSAKIVIVTNWRRWADIDQLINMFAEQGLDFSYADRPSCIRRGMSSERYHDIASHMEDEINEDARVLVIDDYNLQALNHFYRLEGEEGERDGYYGIDHNDEQVGIVQNQDNAIAHDIRFKWLDVDYTEGLTYKQFKLGADFLGVDWDQLNFEEFGIPIKTEEEKRKEREAMDKYLGAFII